MRAHKITLQSLWSLLLPIFLKFLEENDEEYYNVVVDLMSDDKSDFFFLVSSSPNFKAHMENFKMSLSKVPNVQFWFSTWT